MTDELELLAVATEKLVEASELMETAGEEILSLRATQDELVAALEALVNQSMPEGNTGVWVSGTNIKLCRDLLKRIRS